MIRRLAAVGLGSLALLGAATAPATATGVPSPRVSCEIHELPLPPTTGQQVNGWVDGTDGFDTFVGTVASDLLRPAIWRDGKLEVLDTVGEAFDVNFAGDVVGYTLVDGPRAFLYRDGVLQRLPEPPGTELSLANGINDLGDVVGQIRTADGFRAVVWPADEPGTVRLLDSPPGVNVSAADISNVREIAGNSMFFGQGDGFVWSVDGKVIRTLRPSDPDDRVGVRGITATSVVGVQLREDGSRVATTWDRAGEPTLLPEGKGAAARAVSITAVGGSANFSTPLLWVGDQRIELPELDSSGFGGATVNAVTHFFTAAGWANSDTGQVPVTWTCRPKA